jgi:hypothetical protein
MALNDSPPAPVRSSPEHRQPLNFDPETLRDDLAGAFPAPSNADNLQKQPAARSDHAATRPSPSTAASPSGTVGSAANPQRQPFPTVNELLSRRAAAAKTSDNSPKSDRAPISQPLVEHAEADGLKPNPRDEGAKAFEAPIESPAAAPEAVSVAPVKSSESAADHFNAPDKADVAAKPDGTAVLLANRAPVIASEMEGPKQIMVGRDACYHLLLRNEGGAAADDFVASVHIPYWADVVSTSATKGVVRLPNNTESKTQGTLDWQFERLEPQSAETLTLHLVPHESRPLELGVTWTHAVMASKATVEVQEPKLKLQIAGPDEVMFGKAQVYRLTITNPGTGPTENVKIDLMPPGGNDGSVSTHKLGNLAPGTSKSVEVELTARQAGKLSVKAAATAEGGLTSDATKDIFCRKPELEVDWRGPNSQYAGTPATYYFRVRNPGTASADDVSVRVELPEGAKFISASDGQVYDPDRGTVIWRVGSLRPGDDCYTELKCAVNNTGKNQLRVSASTASGDLTDNKLATTDVIGLADLKLDIKDPHGPLPMGEEAVYEINVYNRGNNVAQDVNVVALFSDGLEPVSMDGAQYSVSDGRVAFHGIDKIPPGQTATLRVHAKAMKPGTHVFRAEVQCRDLEIKLAAEETTRFYQDSMTHDEPAAAAPAVGAKPADKVR